MELTPSRPAPELSSLTASTLQSTRFKERKTREVQSDVRNEVVYYSPVIKIDRETASAVIQYRDTKTGEVKNEYPNVPQGVGAYQQAQDTSAKDSEVAEVETDAPKVEPEKAKTKAEPSDERVDQDA